jgi:hypothetical protein
MGKRSNCAADRRRRPMGQRRLLASSNAHLAASLEPQSHSAPRVALVHPPMQIGLPYCRGSAFAYKSGNRVPATHVDLARAARAREVVARLPRCSYQPQLLLFSFRVRDVHGLGGHRVLDEYFELPSDRRHSCRACGRSPLLVALLHHDLAVRHLEHWSGDLLARPRWLRRERRL